MKTAKMAEMPPLQVAIDILIQRNGKLRVLAASVAGIFRAAMIAREVEFLSDDIRRDIGLPARGEPIPPREPIR